MNLPTIVTVAEHNTQSARLRKSLELLAEVVLDFPASWGANNFSAINGKPTSVRATSRSRDGSSMRYGRDEVLTEFSSKQANGNRRAKSHYHSVVPSSERNRV
jgi:hypothetical protein